MTTVKTNKPLMAEMLVRHVFGESESFERVCAQRGISLDEAVSQALKGWVGHSLPATPTEAEMPTLGLLPDPADCPFGQEEHYIGLVQHDLEVLRRRQQDCFRTKDAGELAKTTRAIETHIQTLASLRDRVA